MHCQSVKNPEFIYFKLTGTNFRHKDMKTQGKTGKNCCLRRTNYKCGQVCVGWWPEETQQAGSSIDTVIPAQASGLVSTLRRPGSRVPALGLCIWPWTAASPAQSLGGGDHGTSNWVPATQVRPRLCPRSRPAHRPPDPLSPQLGSLAAMETVSASETNKKNQDVFITHRILYLVP